MSYILNALRKSERERQKNQEQNLTTHLQDDNPGKSAVHAYWLILLIVLNAALFAYVLIRYDGGETSLTVPAPAKKQPALITTTKLPEPSAEQTLPGKSAEPLAVVQAAPAAETIAGLIENKKPQVTDATPTKAQNKTGVKQMPAAEQAVSPDSQVVRVERDETDHLIGKVVEASLKHEAKPSVAPENASESGKPIVESEINDKSGKAENDTPWLEELPSSFRRNVPAIDINVYVYSEQAENRFIMVSMHKYLTGQEISAGMLLKDIQQDGIVVEYRGRQFKIGRK
ncbi:general secretion pathway protein GspB [Methylomarinum vadi]|uniref:general secretion pathway protein GspB n=1 Tax=Methylomarinum vadi TaxID=438855 RepID=UPI0004DF0158|nr:general secretion pathway protein GspB [Methylomarinum vadi]